MNGVEETVGFLVNFGNDAGARTNPIIAFPLTPEVQFLASGEFIGETQDPTIATYQESFGGLFDGRACVRDPRCLNGHAEAHAVTLAQPIR
jgi:hypothetical protein